mmetsp:Transcript_29533/g.44950  ORF Transcript_29533/g.44950 Transcript_29533/m.44950 type:complete len:82 (-) Transcript_29533:1321-1566(-)
MKRIGEQGSGLQLTKGLLSAKKRRRSILNQDAFDKVVENPLRKQATIVKEVTERASSSSHLSCSEHSSGPGKEEEKELANT